MSAYAPPMVAFRGRVDYGDDLIRDYLVYAENADHANRIVQAHAEGLLTISVETDPDPDRDYDDTLGDEPDERLELERAVVLWWPGDEQHRPGFVVQAHMTNGERVFPMGHPQSFDTPEGAWSVAHRLRFDPENGSCWMAGRSDTA